ncbi:S8 family serine peptidase [Pendulispora rubella]|uniref:S8 family serine peptidase n=1 Tax=Pendulispora rubella TaxID=2741070 RepID=A0ABZ2LIW4_9BACT
MTLTFAQLASANSRDVCAPSSDPNTAWCLAKVQTDAYGVRPTLAGPSGLGPADLTSAYSVPSSGTSTGIIAVVDAFDNPNVEADLATYRSTFGLPPCTTANGCFKKVNQRGASSPLPAPDSGWASEMAIDTQLASAICPACRILLVEADGATMADLGAAVVMAVRLGASVVSNSWGGIESAESVDYDRAYFTHDGVTIFASSGDQGYSQGALFPAAGTRVIGVGGTTLARASNARGWTETVWGGSDTASPGTGSGCSSYIARPSWVDPVATPRCAKKTVNDVAAVADPRTGVAIYNTYEGAGWAVYGGTSLGPPIVAAMFVLAGKGAAGGSLIWKNRAAFLDITAGTNANGSPSGGVTCDPGADNLCNAVAGFDAPSGWGTPIASALRDVPFDAGPPPDADPPEDAGPSDAGADAILDAGTDAGTPIPKSDAGNGREPAPTNPADGSSGGSCTIAEPGAASAGASALACALSLLLLRRRRGSR